ncbi:G-type lectin S-receptor-like serine/threonine-protein kinase At2g19130 [Hordeum vulgare subsp. vulgare]|uniref:G-type lectin S-receptor-like serine/threonine-protein kinase At2g19130 n=1 Tax=Hordeum vulgare subsp. vulgare TaxID=112509 RepID=UPI001D1A4F95|nr:G-type lectin S-receptor-like serine/threonine-protein kinase At2g19130 [Hordeum vulgare subsp. vulgare]
MPPHHIVLGLFLLVSLHSPARRCCAATANDDTLMAGQAVDKLVSRNGKFALGFFASGSSTATSKSSSSADTATTTPNWYLGIWFNKIPDFTPVWIANRDEPITVPADHKLQISISRDGNLVVLDHIGAPVWSTEITSKNSSNDTIADVAVLNNNGNLVIRHASGPSQQMWWQSFDYPTEVCLPGSKLGRNKVTGLNRVFVSKKNRINPGRGSYCVGADSSFDQGIKLSLCSSSLVYWASGTFSQQYVDPSDTGLISYNHVDNNQEQYYIYSTPNDEALSIYATVEISGQIKARVWNESLQRWQQFYTQPMDPCSVQAACGPFTICTNNNTNLLCDCMKGFSFKSPGEWDLDNPAGGCMRNNPLDCTADNGGWKEKRLDGARQGEKQLRAEVSSIGLIQHINLVKLIGFCCESDKRLLVYEHMSNGSLDVHLFNSNDIVLDWSIRYQIATGVARGLSYLHEGCRECIIHCDIKPENILLDTSFAPKVADFGLATIVGRDFSRVLTTFRGTVGYLAPEWISGEPITQKVDVYSFGMVLLEIVSGRRNSSKVYTSDSYDTSFFPVQAISMLHGGDVNSLVDPRLHGEFNLEEAIRVCKVAFWCIQDHEYDRPTMGEVVRVLEGLQELDMPPMPRQLAAITKC